MNTAIEHSQGRYRFPRIVALMLLFIIAGGQPLACTHRGEAGIHLEPAIKATVDRCEARFAVMEYGSDLGIVLFHVPSHTLPGGCKEGNRFRIAARQELRPKLRTRHTRHTEITVTRVGTDHVFCTTEEQTVEVPVAMFGSSPQEGTRYTLLAEVSPSQAAWQSLANARANLKTIDEEVASLDLSSSVSTSGGILPFQKR